MSTLREIIHESVREGELYEKLDRNWVRCFACGHCCKIPDGQPGVARFATTRAEPCLCPGAMSAASNATPSRKNRSSMLIRGDVSQGFARRYHGLARLFGRANLSFDEE